VTGRHPPAIAAGGILGLVLVLCAAKQALAKRNKELAALLEIFELVVGGSAGREDHGIKPGAPRRKERKRCLQIGRFLHLNIGCSQASCLGKPVSCNRQGDKRGYAIEGKQARQFIVILLTLMPTGDQRDPPSGIGSQG